jgi:WD40 repeat protein
MSNATKTIGAVVFLIAGIASHAHPAPQTNKERKASGRGVVAWSGTVCIHSGASCGAFSPHGQTFASGGWDDGTIILWQVHNGNQLRRLDQPNEAWVQSLGFSRDGTLLESWALHPHGITHVPTIRLWDVATGKEVFKLALSDKQIAAFSANRKVLAISGAEKVIRLVNSDTGKEMRKLVGHQRSVQALAFSPDGKTLASQGDDETVRLWAAATGKELGRRKWKGQKFGKLAFTSDGKVWVATFGKDEQGWPTGGLWDWAAPKPVLQAPVAISGPFAPGGKFLAGWTGLGPCLGGALLVWNISTAKSQPLVGGHIRTAGPLAFAPDGKVLAAVWGRSSMAAVVQLWDTATARPLVRISPAEGATSVAFSPEGKTLAVTGAKQSLLQKLTHLRGFGGSVSVLALSADGRFLAAGRADGTIDLGNTATGKQLPKLKGHTEKIQAAAFSPDGRLLASGSGDGSICLWTFRTGRLRHRLTSFRGEIHAFGFSEDGSSVQAETPAGSRWWNVRTGKEIPSGQPEIPAQRE